MTESMIESRFWAKVNKAGDCWLWDGCKPHQYGQMRVEGRTKKATHVSVFLASGVWPEAGKMVCHKCDNPPCVRPDHLFVGTNKDNSRDRDIKGRGVAPVCPPHMKSRGEKHGLAKMNTELIRKLRADTGSQRELAKRYGLSQPTVKAILLRRTWAHV